MQTGPNLDHAGTYIIGCERGFSHDNNILITKMTDMGGAEWSPPVKITEVHSIAVCFRRHRSCSSNSTLSHRAMASVDAPVSLRLVPIACFMLGMAWSCLKWGGH